MGNPRVTLPEELHDLVRGVVADLQTAARGFGRDAEPAGRAASAAERRSAYQATILRLPETDDPTSPPPCSPEVEAAPLSPRPDPVPEAGEPATSPTEHRQRAFLARLEVAFAIPRARHPARTRRVPVACRRASPLDAARTSRMLRMAVPAVPVASATLTTAPSWFREVTAPPVAPALPAPPPPPALAATPMPAATVPGLAPAPFPVASPDPASSAVAEKSRPLWRDAGGHLANLGIAAALSFVAIFCALVVGLVVTGHHLEQVVTGSMQPTIPIQSLVVTERVQVSQLRVGDILVFPNPNNTKETIVHRIIWLSHDQSGNVLVRTKGDYNGAPDAWTVKRQASADADRVIWIIPGGGTIAGLLQEAGLWGLVLLVIGVIGFYGLRKVRQILSEDDEEEADAAAEPGS